MTYSGSYVRRHNGRFSGAAFVSQWELCEVCAQICQKLIKHNGKRGHMHMHSVRAAAPFDLNHMVRSVSA